MGLHPERSEWKLLVALAPKIQHWTCAGITALGHSWVVKATWILPRAVPFFCTFTNTMVIFNWLVVCNMNFICPYIGNNNPNWLSNFSEGNHQPEWGYNHQWLDGSDLQHLIRNPDGAIVGRFVYMLSATTKSWSKSRWKSHFFWLKHVHQSWYWTIKIVIFQSLKRQILIIFDANSKCNILDYSSRISADLLIPVLQ